VFDVVCFAFDGASWALLWNDFNGSFFHTNVTISAGPNYLYGVDQGASAIRWNWTTSGLGSRYIARHRLDGMERHCQTLSPTSPMPMLSSSKAQTAMCW
jgi:hypothetical protein